MSGPPLRGRTRRGSAAPPRPGEPIPAPPPHTPPPRPAPPADRPPAPARRPTAAEVLRALAVSGGTGWAAAVARPVLHVCVLYAGPLAFWALGRWRRGWRQGERGPGAAGPVSLAALRDVVVAPLSEELVFRGCMVPVMALAGMSPGGVAATAPVVFAAAHLHHFGDLVTHRGRTYGQAACAVAGMAAYTALFGAYATALLFARATLLAPVAAHALCNWLGFPPLARVFSASEPHGGAVRLLTLAGVGGFAALWPWAAGGDAFSAALEGAAQRA